MNARHPRFGFSLARARAWGILAAMTEPAAGLNAALFCHLSDPAFLDAALARIGATKPCVLTDSGMLLPAIPAHRRATPASLGLDAAPLDEAQVFARVRAYLTALDGLDALIVDMGFALHADPHGGGIEGWGSVAELLADEMGVPVLSIYDQESLVEDQLQAAFRAHQQFLAPSGLYPNPFWLPREVLAASTPDEQLGFLLGRLVPDYAGKPVFRAQDRAAARGATPGWLSTPRPSLARPDPTLAWHIRCLGPLRVVIGGRLTVDWRTAGGAPNKTRTLFAYLLTKGEQGAGADQIGELLWPGTGSDQTKRARLHHTVAMLRQALGQPGAVLREGERYRLNPPPGSRIDITAFEQHCRRGISLARAGQDDAAVRIYLEAERLYGGDLFQDLPSECLTTESEDWVLPRRTWLREMAVKLHYDLSKTLRRHRRLAEAVDHAQKAVAIDATSEPAHAELMRVFHAMGRTEALHRQFRQYRTAQAALGAGQESPEFRAVYDELCRSLDSLSPGQRKSKELVLR